MPEDRVCSKCTNAAFDAAGVYCKVFHEAIDNESVAETCGEWFSYAPTLSVVPVSADSVEQERDLSLLVELHYFGKEEHGVKIEARLRRELGLAFGDQATVRVA